MVGSLLNPLSPGIWIGLRFGNLMLAMWERLDFSDYTSPTAKDPKCGTMANEEAIQTSWFKVMTGMVTRVCWWKHVGVITPHGPHTTSFLITSQLFWNLNVNLSHKYTTYFQLNPHVCPGKHPFVFVLNPNLLLGRIHLAEPIMFSCVYNNSNIHYC